MISNALLLVVVALVVWDIVLNYNLGKVIPLMATKADLDVLLP